MSMTPAVANRSAFRFNALLFSVIAAMVAYLGFSLWAGWQDVSVALGLIGAWGSAVALGMSLINYSLRFGRWQLYLHRLGYNVEAKASFRIYLSGFALTTTPGKAGELFRGVLLKRRGVPFPTSCAAFLSERLSDLIAISLLACLGLSYHPDAQTLVAVGGSGILILLVSLSYPPILDSLARYTEQSGNRLKILLRGVVQMLVEARRCHTPVLLVFTSVISLLAWGAEAVAFHWVLLWIGIDTPLSYAIFVYAVAMLAGALSFLPGGLGGAEASMIGLLLLNDVTMPEAVAATVFIRLATLWFAVMLGLVALWRSQSEGATA